MTTAVCWSLALLNLDSPESSLWAHQNPGPQAVDVGRDSSPVLICNSCWSTGFSLLFSRARQAKACTPTLSAQFVLRIDPPVTISLLFLHVRDLYHHDLHHRVHREHFRHDHRGYVVRARMKMACRPSLLPDVRRAALRP